MSARAKQNRRNQARRRQLLSVSNSCSYCGRILTFRGSTIDHIIARCWGGQDDDENTCLACPRCNRFKDADPVHLLASPIHRGGNLKYVFEVSVSVPFVLEKVMRDQKVRFRYDALEDAVGNEVLQHATEIRGVLERTSAGIVEIGRRLLAVRASLTPEQYKAWLIAEFQWNTACATTYEAVAQKFGNLPHIERFHPSALYMLCRTNIDPRAVKEALKRADRGDVVTRMVVAKLIRKFLPPPPPRPAIAVDPRPTIQARAAISAPPTVTSFRSLLRQFDVTQIPSDERAALANELLELAMQIRTGRMPDGSAVSRPHVAEELPSSHKGKRPELARA